MRAERWIGAIAACGLAWWGVRSIPPPAVLPAGHARLSPEAIGLPEAAELVAVATEDGVTLRGWFLPSDPGAPVVLHFLPTGFSATDPLARGGVAYALADLGLASLVIDYRGVGASEGHVWPQDLEADARACWAEALERAGGDPERVFLRGASIGTLACAELLEDGAQPAGVVLYAPVRAETVAARFVAAWTNEWVGGIAGALLGPIADADLVEALERTSVPIHLSQCLDDELLPREELARVARAANPDGEEGWQGTMGGGHYGAVLGSFDLGRREGPFHEERAGVELPVADRLPRVLAALSAPARARIDVEPGARERLGAIAGRLLHAEADEVAALALAGFDAESGAYALVDDRHPAAPSWLGRIDPADRARVLDVDDPSGPLSPGMVAHWVSRLGEQRASFGPTAAAWASLVDPRRSTAIHGRVAQSMRELPAEAWDLFRGATPLAPRVVARRAARAMLKGLGVPDRLTKSDGGELGLEARFEGGWTEVDLAGLARLLLEPIDAWRPPLLTFLQVADADLEGDSWSLPFPR